MPMRDGEGRITRWFGTCTDIQERRLAEEALRDADRRKDEFLAMLAHELRNPLAPIRNALHRSCGWPGTTGEAQRWAREHDRAAGPAPGPAGGRPAGRVPHHPGQDRRCTKAPLDGRHGRRRRRRDEPPADRRPRPRA